MRSAVDSGREEAVAAFALALADDELILAHRNSEWTGHAPILEEDIAFSNIAQDELGHASLWYGLVRELTGDDPDRLVFFREPQEFRNVQLVELPIGDWAFTITRQFLFDAYELIQLENLVDCDVVSLSNVAAKIKSEEHYHYRHSSTWLQRLGLGTEESNQRTQLALDELWPFTNQLFQDFEETRTLSQAGHVAPRSELHQRWSQWVMPFLQDAGLQIPSRPPCSISRSDHSDHLVELLQELQEVARMDPQAKW